MVRAARELHLLREQRRRRDCRVSPPPLAPEDALTHLLRNWCCQLGECAEPSKGGYLALDGN